MTRCLIIVSVWLLSGMVTLAEDETTAQSLIPFDSLTVSNRLLVRSVTDHYTLRRVYSAKQFNGCKEHLEFLMDHMDACSALAQKLGLIQYRATRDAQGHLCANNHEGSAGWLVNVFVGDGKHIYYVEGAHRGVFKVKGRGVAVVEVTRKEPDTMEYTGALFVKVDNVVLAALAQLFSVFLRNAVDRNFEHVMRHPITLCEKALNNPRELLRQIDSMPDNDKALLEPFTKLLRSAATDAGQPPPQ